MLTVGRVCMKIAGRDAGKTAVVVDQVDGTYVMVDGQVRRKKCNIAHLEPLNKVLKLKKGASHADVKKVFESDLKIKLEDTKKKEAKPRPTQKRKVKAKPAKKPAAKKETKAAPAKK